MNNKTPTNIHNIPKGIYDAINTDFYTNPNDKFSHYSATKLISPIQETILVKRHEKEIPPSDIMDNFNAWRGSIIHNAIEAAAKLDMNYIEEQRFYATVLGKVVSGKVDCYDIDKKQIIDWKTCGLWKLQKNDVRAWEEQANIYAYLMGQEGYEIKSLKITAILMDWKKTESKYKPNYPVCQIVPIDLKLWSTYEQERFIKQQLIYLKAGQDLTADELYKELPCSKYDQWSTYQDTAIMKKGSTRATRKFFSRKETKAFVEENVQYLSSEYEIVDRYGLPTKCIDYCSAAPFCSQRKAEEAARTGNINIKKLTF